MAVSNLKSRADVLKLAASDWLLRYKYATLFELGLLKWGRRRADVVGISVRGEITVIEVKSGHKDLITDKKWQEYLAVCDRLYFCFGYDHWAAKKAEILKIVGQSRAGILVLTERGQCAVVKAANKNPDFQTDARIGIIARMVWRNGDRNAAKNHRSRRHLPVEERITPDCKVERKTKKEVQSCPPIAPEPDPTKIQTPPPAVSSTTLSPTLTTGLSPLPSKSSTATATLSSAMFRRPLRRIR